MKFVELLKEMDNCQERNSPCALPDWLAGSVPLLSCTTRGRAAGGGDSEAFRVIDFP